MAINFEELILEIVKPLVIHPDDVKVTAEVKNKKDQSYIVYVNDSDMGRIIGKHGNTANAIRTLLYAAATKDNIQIRLEIKSLDEVK